MYIIGVSAYYHDSSACLFKDDELIFACEEEKFTGIKHDNSFPYKAIEHIFTAYGLTKSDIECVCYYEKPILRLKRRKSFLKSLGNNILVWRNLRKISNKIHYTPHHISHMTYSYLTSNFINATLVSIDGVGETATVSFGKGENGKVTQLKTIEYPNSLGLFYSAMTAFLGFKPNEGEYKVMGLASYGDPSIFRDKLKLLIHYGASVLDCNLDAFCWDKSNDMMFNEKLEELLGIEARMVGDPITQLHKDLAASVQERYESIFFQLISSAKLFYDTNNLCLGGGCAYNGSANGKVVPKGLYDRLWIPPAPSDAGSSVGTCLDYLSRIKGRYVKLNPSPFLGPSYNRSVIQDAITKTPNIIARKYKLPKLLTLVASLLSSGLVVGWYQDRIEFGARALGNRSILANPTISSMKDTINKVIKKREGFRPFAPMVCFEDQGKYFESDEYVPYMNQVVKVKEEYRDILVAVTHIDGTARIQSVAKNAPCYDLLKEFEKITGYPILLNTSFNVKDKTMVLTPQDAMDTFLSTDMDVLVMGDYIIYKQKSHENNRVD